MSKEENPFRTYYRCVHITTCLSGMLMASLLLTLLQAEKNTTTRTIAPLMHETKMMPPPPPPSYDDETLLDNIPSLFISLEVVRRLDDSESTEQEHQDHLAWVAQLPDVIVQE